MHTFYRVVTCARDTWTVTRTDISGVAIVYVTRDYIGACRTRDELERADRKAFYEGLIVGHSEAA